MDIFYEESVSNIVVSVNKKNLIIFNVYLKLINNKGGCVLNVYIIKKEYLNNTK